jgi:type IV pilus assembly protein PilE
LLLNISALVHNVFSNTGSGALIMILKAKRNAANQTGYSLIELMVVVAIVGIIAAIAYPSYQGYLDDTYQAQAIADLKVCALAVERYYSDSFTYVGATAGTGTGDTCNSVSPTQGVQQYVISIVSATANDYTVQAKPVGGGACGGECIQLKADGTQTVL